MGKKLWGGRFKKPMDRDILDFTKSISFDKRLAPYDIEGSIAYAQMLGKCKIISKKEKDLLVKGLRSLKERIGRIPLENNEDIHTAVINLLRKEIGKTADKLHLGRSRNDQVVLDLRLYCKDEVKQVIEKIKKLQRSLWERAKDWRGLTIPFYTHLKNAQFILFAHQFLAYIGMLERDKGRLGDVFKRMDIMPLGSGAGRGSGLPLDRFYLAKKLNFSQVSENSLDSVSDRDFVIEFLSTLAILSMHLSRISEDFILFCSDEFGFIEGDDSHFTGSSILPHKKNPDPLELIRGYTGKMYGNLISVLVMMKGLPLSYNRDMQLDKPPLFDSLDIIKDSLNILEKIVSKLKVNKENLKRASSNEFIFATDIAEFLVTQGYSWQEAHNLTGKLVLESIRKKKPLKEMSDKELKKIIPELTQELILDFLDPLKSVRRIKTYGGSGPESVENQIKHWGKILR
ncbi:MAG: argininosuccinate lyase [Candidatus Omnitrophica bacterium]|nr:argininosuccinate lyase [Candidatus Omnitrophota bacterium]MCM8793810.1 argininosuccinate lyase [Candidatus Omnitrophota bacterium]